MASTIYSSVNTNIFFVNCVNFAIRHLWWILFLIIIISGLPPRVQLILGDLSILLVLLTIFKTHSMTNELNWNFQWHVLHVIFVGTFSMVSIGFHSLLKKSLLVLILYLIRIWKSFMNPWNCLLYIIGIMFLIA